jgi:sarcosine oxidase
MARRALSLWRELENETATSLLSVVGGVHHGASRPLTEISEALAAHGVHSELLSPAEASQRFTGMRFEGSVLFQPDEARINAQQATDTLVELATGLGAEFNFSQRVEKISLNDDNAVVHSDSCSYSTKVVVATCGAWVVPLVGGLVTLPEIEVTEQQPAYFAPTDHQANWPVFVHRFSTRGLPEEFGGFYGMYTPHEGLKVGERRGGPIVNPDLRDGGVDPEMLARLAEYVSQWFPGVDPTPFASSPCMYTTTKNENFILDRRGPLVIGSPCSGHGFKFVPEIGRILADLAQGIPQPYARFLLPS